MKRLAIVLSFAFIGTTILADVRYRCVELDRISVSADGRMSPAFPGRILNFLQKGQNVVIVEDLISTGNSSLLAVDALRAAGANIKGMAAIFTYGFDIATKNFEKENIYLNTLSNYENLLEQALETNYISEKELKTLSEWNTNPSEWNAN